MNSQTFKVGDIVQYCPIKCAGVNVDPTAFIYTFIVDDINPRRDFGRLVVHSVLKPEKQKTGSFIDPDWNRKPGDYFGNGSAKYWKKVKLTSSGKVSIND